MSTETPVRPSDSLKAVRYEIRGRLARRAHELERLGYEIISLNIGNPRLFGFRTPETMRLAMIENLSDSEGYCHQKGVFPAREAVVMQQQDRGISGVSAEEVFIGNGVSELIDMVLRALLNDGDEVLVPSPDYPLWTAAVNLNRGRAVHYPCRPENGFVPDPAQIEALITRRTRALVIIDPNNPTGAAYPRAVLERLARLAERHKLVRVQRRDLRPDGLRRRRVDPDGDAGAGHPLRDTFGTVENLPRLRLSRRLGGVSGRLRGAATIWRRSNCCPRCDCAAMCRRNGRCRPRWVATRASARSSARAGGCTNPAAAILEAVARSRFLQLQRAHRRHVCVCRCRYAGAAGIRRSAVCARPAGAEACARGARA